MDDLLGLNAPEPLREYYSRSFYRATWVFTALDAGFWTAMSVRPRPLRHLLSLLFSLYYLVFTNRAVEKVRKVRALITVDHLRVSWNKGVDNPVLRFVRSLHSSRLTVSRIVDVPDRVSCDEGSSTGRLSDIAQLEPAKCHVMYAGDPEAFAACRYIVLNYPGGGFVSMGPECHSDYLSAWAEKTGAVVVSVDYAKAPEYPYPYAIDQCYEVYREILQTGGRCIGLDGSAAASEDGLRVVLAGDSAGGNITAGVMFRILESADKLPPPEGIVFIYGCFNVDIRAWMTRQETRMLLGAPDTVAVDSARSHGSLVSLVDNRDHLHHVSPLAVTNRDDGYQKLPAAAAAAAEVDSSHERIGAGLGRRRGRPVYVDDRVRVVCKQPLLGKPDDDDDDDDEYNGSSGNEEDAHNNVGPAADARHGQSSESGKVGYVPLSMTSSFTYFNDQILTPEMMRAMIIMYIGPNGRPNFRTDYYLSPAVAPDHLLERFPPVYFMCGEKDPMVDDTVLFAARIRKAKQRSAEKAQQQQQQQQEQQQGVATVRSKKRADKPADAGSSTAGDKAAGATGGARTHEYRDYKSSILYSRRHSQPRLLRDKRSTSFYIGSTDVSDNDDDGTDAWTQSAGQRTSGGSSIGTGTGGGAAAAATAQMLQLPASLRMSHIPPADQPSRHRGRRQSAFATAVPSPPVIKVKIIAGMSHGFMQMYSILPESKRVANTMASWLSELLYGDHNITAFSRCASVIDGDGTFGARRASVASASDFESDVACDGAEDASWGVVERSVGKHLAAGHHRGRYNGSAGRDQLEIEAGNGISIRVTSPPPPPPVSASASASASVSESASPSVSTPPSSSQPHQQQPASGSNAVFERGPVDKHGIEIVSAANMVRRRGQGLADPLN
ncbi:hypothetical protein LPJ56_001474 [Coemansia sp. RSA 2599]|nr:hypothetical protein LPJ56_001474 [Coemansia sp. RSA 2599]